MKSAIACIVFVAAALVRSAGSEVQPAQGQAESFLTLSDDAQRAVGSQSWDAAAEKYHAIIELARQRHEELWEARGLLGLGGVSNARARYDEARRLVLESLGTFERLEAWQDVGRAANRLGTIAANLGETDEARRRFDDAIVAADRAGDLKERAIARFNLIRSEPAASDASLASLGTLFVEVQQLGDKDFEGDILHVWGDRFFNRGEYEPAIEKLEEAAERYRQTGNKNDLSRVYNSFGRLFRAHGQMTAALQAQLKALAIQQSLDSPRNRLQSLNAVAVTYQSLGNARKARDYYERAIAVADQIGASNTRDFLRANFGNFLVQSGDVERGRVELEQSLPGASPWYRAVRLTQLAWAYRVLHRFEDAVDAANRAIDACHAATPLDCVQARLGRAGAELGLGVTDAALADVTAALGSLEQVHSTLAASDFLKQGFNQLWSSAYSVAIDLHARQGEWTAALEAAELARARAFVDLLASRDAVAEASRPRPVAVVNEDEEEGPRSEASAAPTTVDDLIAIAAKRRATLLQYWSAADRLFVWVVTPGGTVRGASVNVGQAQVERLVRSIAPESASGPNREAAWKALYTALIEPIDRYLPRSPAARLIVVPHGPLIHVPFAALRDRQGRYLIERFTLSSVPSAAALRFTSTRRHRDSRHGALLLVADPSPAPSIPGEARLPRLPGALEEARAIARLVPASRTTLLAETVATGPRVLEAVRRPAVIHFATHAIVRDADPMSSFLALAAPHGGAEGKLTAQQIYGLTLDADMVVLSACRSGAGPITGDGIASLARAFFYAGAPSVIVSVWDVADEPAQRLLVAFYRSWLAGADKDRALRAAQLEFLRDLRAGKVTVHTPAGAVALVESPSVWAGFVLLGEPD